MLAEVDLSNPFVVVLAVLAALALLIYILKH